METRQLPQRPGRSWLISVAVAALAAAAVNIVAQSTGRFHWWAGFVLVPGAFIAAAGGPLLARGGGRAFAGYVISCVGALVFAVGALLMFGAVGSGWQLMISLPALAVAGTYLWRSDHPLLRGLHRTVMMLALLTVLLGGTFLAMRAGWIEVGRVRWWGGFMMAAGLIVGGNGLELTRHRMAYRLQAVTLAMGPAVLTFLLGLRHLRGW